jgi:hypothetical protein
MIELANDEIFAYEATDRSLCQLAAEASYESHIILQLSSVDADAALPIGKAATRYVLQGLAKISLQEPGYDYHGITQKRADRTIDKLSGDIEYFFYPILAKAAKREE